MGQASDCASQSRGGCSCAGPYGHRLLAIDAEHSHGYDHEVAAACEGVKPGWVRLNFNYFITEAVRDYLVEAVRLIARHGHRLLTDYVFDPHTGVWQHRAKAAVPLRLPDLRSVATADTPTTSDGVLASQLEDARCLLAARADLLDDGPTGLPEDFEALGWFVLPPVCLLGQASARNSFSSVMTSLQSRPDSIICTSPPTCP